MINLILFPRIHLTLIDFTMNGYRKFGGVGFSISEPLIKLSVNSASNFQLVFRIKNEIIEYDNKILPLLSNFYDANRLSQKASFEFDLEYAPHYGFGTGTNMTLACLECLLILNKKDYSNSDLVYASLRGRTSGIGIQTYFKGGFVFDSGVKNFDNVFIPSNLNRSNLISIPLITHKMPSWPLLVCVPYFLKNINPSEEKDFFLNNTPIDAGDVKDILYHSAFGLSTSILENDFDSFCSSLKEIQKTKWKALERASYGTPLIELETDLYSLGAKVVAMSSLGPSLVIFGDNLDKIEKGVKQKYGDNVEIFCAVCNNKGRVIND